MSEQTQELGNPYSKDELTSSLNRLRKRLTYVKDEMDITSYAIRGIEMNLQEIEQEDKEANETNA